MSLTVRRRGLLNGGPPLSEIAPPAMNMPAQQAVKAETGAGQNIFLSCTGGVRAMWLFLAMFCGFIQKKPLKRKGIRPQMTQMDADGEFLFLISALIPAT